MLVRYCLPASFPHLVASRSRSWLAVAVPALCWLNSLSRVGPPPLSSAHLPILDADRLGALQQAIGRDALEALVDRFGPSVDADLVRIRGGMVNGDRHRVAEAAHSLKGLAVTFGAARLQSTAQALQTGAEGSAELTGLIAAIEVAAESTKAAVGPAVAGLD